MCQNLVQPITLQYLCFLICLLFLITMFDKKKFGLQRVVFEVNLGLLTDRLIFRICSRTVQCDPPIHTDPSMSVCMFICHFANVTQKLGVQTSPDFLTCVICSHGSEFIWQRCSALCNSGFVMFAYNRLQ